MTNKFRTLVKEGMSKQGRSLRAGDFDIDAMTLRSVTNCGTANDLAKDLVVKLDPAEPVSGQEYTTFTSYTLEDGVTIDSGKAYYKATLSGFPIVNTSDDLCEDLKSGSTPCPLSGHVESTDKSTVPSGVHGDLVSSMRWTDGSDREILCLSFEFYI